MKMVLRVVLVATSLQVTIARADICSDVKAVMAQAPDRFRSLTKEDTFDARLQEYDATMAMAGASLCTVDSERAAFACSWDFQPDDEVDATALADSLRQSLQACLSPGTTVRERNRPERQMRSTIFGVARDNLEVRVARWLFTSKHTGRREWVVDVTVERN